ncbi:MAG: 5'-nucleotidase C-terminal domain-containing protein [Tepidanaerobacteraceae bacterium]
MKKKDLLLRVSIVPLILLALLVMLFTEAPLSDYDRISVIIVHTNDVHGSIWAKESEMGYAHMAAIVKEIREANNNVLLLDAGDTFQGSSVASLSQGESIVKIMNSMGYDAMVVGNHDFAYGWQRLSELAEKANFPLLSANVRKPDGVPLLETSTIKELDGLKVGIFGLTTTETPRKTHPRNVEGLIFDDPVHTAKQIVEVLNQECDLIIALVHLPLIGAQDSCARLAEEVEGIDLIVSGHSHIPLENGMVVNDTLIVQAGEMGENLGLVSIEVRDGKLEKAKATLYTPGPMGELRVDSKVQSIINDINKENELLMSEVIGWTDVFLNGEKEYVRTSRTNLGNLVAEAMLEATGADGAIMNGGGIRTSIEVREITRADVINVLPLNNYVILIEMKGSDLIQALEHGVSFYPEISGAFPQVAGIDFSFSADKEPGNRLVEVTIGGQELDPEKMYRIAINDFMLAGGSGYTIFEKGRVLGEYGLLVDIVAEYIQNNLNINVESLVSLAAF